MNAINPLFKVGDLMAEIIMLHQKVGRKQAFQMALRTLEEVNIPDPERAIHQYSFELSGGEQQRVAIASILALEPKILVLDEPTAPLDPLMARSILLLLKEIQRSKQITVIISEHRLDLTLPLSDEIIIMNEGRVLEHDVKEKVINGENFQKIKIDSNYTVIVGNIITQENRSSAYDTGIFLTVLSHNNNISNNIFHGNGEAIFIENSYHNIISHNIIDNAWDGICLTRSSNHTTIIEKISGKESPACVTACPTGALKDPDIDQNECIYCGNCTKCGFKLQKNDKTD
jgi:parallel beta-helix repeat protein